MKQLKLMNVRKVIALTVLGAVATAVAGTALATPPSGITPTLIARGTLEGHFKIKLRDSSSPGDVAIQQIVLAPGGHSGWHAHPGPALVTVKSGAVTFHQDDCSSKTYTAGQVALESTGHIHRASNASTTASAEIWVTFLDVPAGSPLRSDAADPGC